MSGHFQSHLQRIPAAEDKGADGLRPDCQSSWSGEGGWSLCGCQGGRGHNCLCLKHLLKQMPAAFAHDEDEGVSERGDAKLEVWGPRNGY